MKCKYCNSEIKEGEKFCMICGNKVEISANSVNASQDIPNVAEPLNKVPRKKYMYNHGRVKRKKALIGLMIVAVSAVVISLFNTDKGLLSSNKNSGNEYEQIDENNMIVYSGFRFPIMDDLIIETDVDKLIVKDEEQSWKVSISLEYKDIKKACISKETLTAIYEDIGAHLTIDPHFSNLEGYKYYIYENQMNNSKGKLLTVLVDAGEEKTFSITSYSKVTLEDKELIRVFKLLDSVRKVY